jgi:protein-arginine kinase activator protein McsA
MKKIFLTALLVVGLTTFAQVQKESPKTSEVEQLSPEKRIQVQLEKISKNLNLSADQKIQVEQIIKERSVKIAEMKAKLQALHAGKVKPSNEDRALIKEELVQEKSALVDKMKSVLTSEQFEKWNSIRAKSIDLKDEKWGGKKRKSHSDDDLK